MVVCKECGGTQVVKNGVIDARQRYKCKECGCNFRAGDARTRLEVQAKRAFCILFYSMAQGSYRLLARILRMSHTQIYQWIALLDEKLPIEGVSGRGEEMDVSTVQKLLASQNSPLDATMPVFVVHGSPWEGCTVLMLVQNTKEQDASHTQEP